MGFVQVGAGSGLMPIFNLKMRARRPENNEYNVYYLANIVFFTPMMPLLTERRAGTSKSMTILNIYTSESWFPCAYSC